MSKLREEIRLEHETEAFAFNHVVYSWIRHVGMNVANAQETVKTQSNELLQLVQAVVQASIPRKANYRRCTDAIEHLCSNEKCDAPHLLHTLKNEGLPDACLNLLRLVKEMQANTHIWEEIHDNMRNLRFLELERLADQVDLFRKLDAEDSAYYHMESILQERNYSPEQAKAFSKECRKILNRSVNPSK